MRTLIAFDLDDTLYKEMTYVASGYRAVASRLAEATGADAALLYDIISAGRPIGFEAALDFLEGRPGSEEFDVATMVEIYRAHTPDIQLTEGVADTLRQLKDSGYGLALITDGSTRHQRAKIKALGLENYFDEDAILISEETGGDKTTDTPWHIAEKSFGADSFVYVGDNLSKDFAIPNRRGWLTVMLRDVRGENVFPQVPTDWPETNRPQKTIDSFYDLPNQLIN